MEINTENENEMSEEEVAEMLNYIGFDEIMNYVRNSIPDKIVSLDEEIKIANASRSDMKKFVKFIDKL